MENIGFSDHLLAPHEIDLGYNVVTQETLPLYKQELLRLKNQYKDKINLFIGGEADLFSTIDLSGLEYVIGSVHYLEFGGKIYPIDHTKAQQLEYVNDACNGDLILFAKNYFNAIYECTKKHRPDIIGHFDIITKFSVLDEENSTYQKIACESLEKCLKITNLLEVNTGAISRGYRSIPYPADFLLKCAYDLNADIILSSDSHNKDTVCYFFEECIPLLKRIGFKNITKLTKEGFVKEKI
jgi:histidinol-phosphatase (PHP family)